MEVARLSESAAGDTAGPCVALESSRWLNVIPLYHCWCSFAFRPRDDGPVGACSWRRVTAGERCRSGEPPTVKAAHGTRRRQPALTCGNRTVPYARHAPMTNLLSGGEIPPGHPTRGGREALGRRRRPVPSRRNRRRSARSMTAPTGARAGARAWTAECWRRRARRRRTSALRPAAVQVATRRRTRRYPAAPEVSVTAASAAVFGRSSGGTTATRAWSRVRTTRLPGAIDWAGLDRLRISCLPTATT